MKKVIIKDNVLIHGDCIGAMDSLIQENVRVNAIITDLPYKVTTCDWDSIVPFTEMWECIDKLITDNGALCLFGCEPFSSKLRLSNLGMYKYDWIWHKSSCSNFINSNYQPRKMHELISVFSKGQAAYSRNGKANKMVYFPQMGEKTVALTKVYKDTECRKAFSKKSSKGYELKHNNVGQKFPEAIIYFAADKHKVHPTQKPVALLEYLIKTYTNEGDTVLDFTAGSFSTAIACINTGRKFIGIEIKEEYFNIGVERIEERIREQDVRTGQD